MPQLNENFSTIILVGGKGSRFSKIESPPKHLTKLNKNLILINIINYINRSGFKHFIFPLGYKKKYFIKFFNSKHNQRKFQFKVIKNKVTNRDLQSKNKIISYFDAGKDTNKMTRIVMSLKYSSFNNLLIVYGDDIVNIDFKKIKDLFFKNKKKKVIVSVYKKNSQYGHLKINNRNEVKEFIEKPPHPLPINIGYYMINTLVIDDYYKKHYELEIDFLPLLAKKNLLRSFEHKGYFYSINDKKEFLTAKKNLKNL
tara:strand:- start:104 stop:868 length:765 start_codon:yes stop_codon:yes gene_type:complete